jgi:hypothetical protein
MKYTYILVTIISSLLISCEQKTKSNEQIPETDNLETIVEKLPQSHEVVYEIENNISNLHEVRSLRWEKTVEENSEFREVHAYMNDEGVPSKIVEFFSMGNFKEQGERHYYFVNSEVMAVVKKADVWIDSNTVAYTETETFYENGKPILSRVRSSDYLDEIEEQAWKKIRTVSQSDEIKTVNNILKGKGAFRTHFISVIKGQEQLFLLLGEPKDENRYVTTVLANPRMPFVSNLLRNLESYKFRPIDIQFQVAGGNGNPEFRMLTSAKWAD